MFKFISWDTKTVYPALNVVKYKNYFLRATKVATYTKMPPFGGKIPLYLLPFHKREACPEKLTIAIFIKSGAKIRVFATNLKIVQCALLF